MSRRILQCRFVCGERRGQMVLIPRIFSYEDQNLPFKLKRSQFPVRLAFAMSIEKAQGQSFSRIGLLLGGDVVSHGQLYAALSRVRSRQGLTVQGQSSRPLNIVYNEVFYDLRWHTRTKEKRDLGDIDHPEDETLPKLIKLSSDQNSDFHHEKITSRQSSFASADEVNLPFLEVKVEPTEITEMAYSTADFQDSSISKASNTGEFKNRFASVASADDVSHPRLLEVILEPNEITEMTEIHNGQSADPLALENLF